LVPASLGLAAAADSRFDVSEDGVNVDFDLHEVARREVLDRLLGAGGIQLVWLSRDVAEEPIRGHFRGRRSAVVRDVLAPLDFVLAVDRVDGEVRITRVVVVGRSSGQGSPGLGMLEAAMKKAEERETSVRTSATKKDEKGGDTPRTRVSGGVPARTGGWPLRPFIMAGAPTQPMPTPIPTRSDDPASMPVPRPVPSNVPPPTPLNVPLPSVAPIAGAPLPPLPMPGPQPAAEPK
jgi:hypothetical protein